MSAKQNIQIGMLIKIREADKEIMPAAGGTGGHEMETVGQLIPRIGLLLILAAGITLSVLITLAIIQFMRPRPYVVRDRVKRGRLLLDQNAWLDFCSLIAASGAAAAGIFVLIKGLQILPGIMLVSIGTGLAGGYLIRLRARLRGCAAARLRGWQPESG